MLKFIKLFAAIAFISLMTSGCVNVAQSKVNPTTQLSALKTMYVQHYESDNSGVNEEIAEHLRSKGVVVTTGAGTPPPGIDALVTYEDHWRWDITMYMLKLNVTIRDPNTEYVLASGDSLHTSLTRKSQTEMVTEVIDNIYSGQALPTADSIQAAANTASSGAKKPLSTLNAKTLPQKLDDLKALKENGTITDAEYAKKRQQLIDQM